MSHKWFRIICIYFFNESIFWVTTKETNISDKSYASVIVKTVCNRLGISIRRAAVCAGAIFKDIGIKSGLNKGKNMDRMKAWREKKQRSNNFNQTKIGCYNIMYEWQNQFYHYSRQKRKYVLLKYCSWQKCAQVGELNLKLLGQGF